MSNYSKFLISTGPLAGQTVVGYELLSRETPDGLVNQSFGRGLWIPALNVRVPADVGQQGHPTAYTNLVVAYDMFNTEITVGATLHAVSSKEVVRVKVLGFGKSYHNGCGWWTRQVKVIDLDSNRKSTINNPSLTILVGATS